MQPFHYLGRDLAAMPILITDYFVLYNNWILICFRICVLFFFLKLVFVYCCETEVASLRH